MRRLAHGRVVRDVESLANGRVEVRISAAEKREVNLLKIAPKISSNFALRAFAKSKKLCGLKLNRLFLWEPLWKRLDSGPCQGITAPRKYFQRQDFITALQVLFDPHQKTFFRGAEGDTFPAHRALADLGQPLQAIFAMDHAKLAV